MNVHSVSAELATLARKTRGIVPPKLVGASTTVVGNKMYLFGGRLVVERRMLSDLFVFDLETFTWDKIEPLPDQPVPGPRYFHSADAWNNHLIIFGGMGYRDAEQTQESLCVLNDVCFYSLSESRWLPAEETPSSPLSEGSLTPRARYAHLSSVSSDMLFIIGGQDLNNGWLDDIHVYNLPSRSWVQRIDYPRHCGTYRSVALSSSLCVRNPSDEPPPTPQPRTRRENASSVLPVTSPDTLIELPYSTAPTPDFPNEIFLYSNYNFTDVKRELEVFTPQPPSSFSITDRSNSMTGIALPPGLRFPTGALLGTSLIIAGTYLAHSYQAFSIWSLDLTTMQWSRIEPGTALATGSWCRAVLWRESNKLLVFGNREGNLVEDYNHRLLSWDHVAYIDLEAFGIYQPPAPGRGFGHEAQEMGLAALEDGVLADFEVICDDGRSIPCSRKMLEDRWPWFRTQRQRYVAAASSALDNINPGALLPLPAPAGSTDPSSTRPDPRLTPRTLHLAEPYAITVAFLQYLYAQALLTPLQHAPAVLSALMLLASTYEMDHLKDLVKHAMHRALSTPGHQNVSGIYDVATLCDCQSLRLRAMRLFRASRRPPHRPRTGRSDHERHGGPGSSHGRGSGHHHHARPRGMSDANAPQGGSSESGSTDQGQGVSGYQVNGTTHSQKTEGSSTQDTHNNIPLLLRRPLKKSTSTKDLKPVSEVPSLTEEYPSSPPEVVEYPASEDEELDPDLFGVESALASAQQQAWSSNSLSRASYNERPSSPHLTSNRPNSDDYFFGTQPDHSPLTSSFPAPDKASTFHLPYRAASRSSRSTSISDIPFHLDTRSVTYSSEDSHRSSGITSLSEGTSSSVASSGPVTPLSPALAGIVDAVAKVTPVSTSQETRLLRQTSLQSIDELDGLDSYQPRDSYELEKYHALSRFPLPPQNTTPASRRPSRPNTGTSNASENEEGRSPDWLRIDATESLLPSPGQSFSSLELTPSSPPTLSGKSSFSSLSNRRSNMTPVPLSGGSPLHPLSPMRGSPKLEKDVAKSQSNADRLEQNLWDYVDREAQRIRDQAKKDVQFTLPGTWAPPKSSKFIRVDEKRRQKELEKQKTRDIAEQARARVERRTFEANVGRSGEKWAVSGVGGL